MIRIKNLRNEKPSEAWQVRVDRSSILGNPFYMATEAQRDSVCERYAVYFEAQIKSNLAFRNEMRRLFKIYRDCGRLELFCWCAPKRCHAEVIKDFLENAMLEYRRSLV